MTGRAMVFPLCFFLLFLVLDNTRMRFDLQSTRLVTLVRHSQQAEENFLCVPISTAWKLKLPEMASVVSESG